MSWIIAIVLLGILIFVHELGHLLAGLMVGIKAEAFSIGFGPALIKKDIRGIRFQISCIPFGGYCKFKGEVSEDEKVGEDDFINMSPLKRIVVYFAGPFFNYVFAVLLLIILVSMPLTRVLYPPTVSVFSDGKYLQAKPGYTVAYEYGIESGDTIMAVNGNKVESDYDVLSAINNEALKNNAENIEFTITRNTETINISVPTLDILKGISGERSLGLYFGNGLRIKNIVGDSAAKEAGLEVGDEILAINGESVKSIADFRPIIMESPSEKVTITVLRNGKEITREAIPRPTSSSALGTFGTLGVEFETIPMKTETIAGTPFPNSVGKAFKESFNYINSYINGLKLLFTGKLSLRENLGGPVRILQLTSQVVETGAEYRINAILSFTATISLVLFLMNLLPLPVVDGGMIVLSFIELVRRRPIDRKMLSKIQMVGAVFLIMLAIFITANDITQLFR